MERRTYERMVREIRAIHLAITGEELRVDDDVIARAASGDEPASPISEDELVRRFTELGAQARSIPSVALELWALGFDDGGDDVSDARVEHELARRAEEGRSAPDLAARADAED